MIGLISFRSRFFITRQREKDNENNNVLNHIKSVNIYRKMNRFHKFDNDAKTVNLRYLITFSTFINNQLISL